MENKRIQAKKQQKKEQRKKFLKVSFFVIIFLILGTTVIVYGDFIKNSFDQIKIKIETIFQKKQEEKNIIPNDIIVNNNQAGAISDSGKLGEPGADSTQGFINPQEIGTGTITNNGETNLSGNQTYLTGTITNSGTQEEKPIIKTEIPKPKIVKIKDIYNFNKYLGIGNTGKDVTKLQKMLANYGYYKGDFGTFDEATGTALANFIKAKTGTSIAYTQLGPQALKVLNEIRVK
ncbi:MAG: peptidoglycan-binding domain-containing protein [Candidatus Gracilibacteria bacterium]|nr:peptidoglycan-binding domain-containing protein [Candidatus Gracilibacteria bacterium]